MESIVNVYFVRFFIMIMIVNLLGWYLKFFGIVIGLKLVMFVLLV